MIRMELGASTTIDNLFEQPDRKALGAGTLCTACSFSDRFLRSKMLSVHTPARFKLLCA
jgi:hypothetical protein